MQERADSIVAAPDRTNSIPQRFVEGAKEAFPVAQARQLPQLGSAIADAFKSFLGGIGEAGEALESQIGGASSAIYDAFETARGQALKTINKVTDDRFGQAADKIAGFVEDPGIQLAMEALVPAAGLTRFGPAAAHQFQLVTKNVHFPTVRRGATFGGAVFPEGETLENVHKVFADDRIRRLTAVADEITETPDAALVQKVEVAFRQLSRDAGRPVLKEAPNMKSRLTPSLKAEIELVDLAQDLRKGNALSAGERDELFELLELLTKIGGRPNPVAAIVRPF